MLAAVSTTATSQEAFVSLLNTEKSLSASAASSVSDRFVESVNVIEAIWPIWPRAPRDWTTSAAVSLIAIA